MAGRPDSVSRGAPIAIQYDCRRDAEGWTVFDRWTGVTVLLGDEYQQGLTQADAQVLAGVLNQRRDLDDRRILQ